MYINKSCSFKDNSANKCNRIFRPWDSASSCDNSQDSTVSTTTVEDSQEPIDICDIEGSSEEKQTFKEGFRPLNKSSNTENVQCPPKCSQQPYVLDAFTSIYPDIVQPNLVQSLGISQTDSLLFESVAQGFALEEYARVLNQEHQAKLLAAKKQRPKKYKCPHCDVGFSNNGQLKGHIRIHTGERPFKCDEKDCGKTFTRNEELTRHKRIHSGLRPFPCTHCGKRFGRKDHLKKHSRTHFQPRGLYAVPVMLPYDTWASGSSAYPFIPMMGY